MSAKKPLNHCPVCGVKIKRSSKACRKHQDKSKNADERIKRLIATNKKYSAEKHYNWSGNKISYSGLHKWLRKVNGKPTHCEGCQIGKGLS